MIDEADYELINRFDSSPADREKILSNQVERIDVNLNYF